LLFGSLGLELGSLVLGNLSILLLKHRVLCDQSLNQRLLLVEVGGRLAQLLYKTVHVVSRLNNFSLLLVLVHNLHDAGALFPCGNSGVGVGQKLLEALHLVEGRVVGLECYEVGHRETPGQDE